MKPCIKEGEREGSVWGGSRERMRSAGGGGGGTDLFNEFWSFVGGAMDGGESCPQRECVYVK